MTMMTEEERLAKNKRIKEAGKATREKRKSQIRKVFTVKIDISRLNKTQKEQLKMIFVEAKWIYNDAITFSKNNNIFDYDTKVKQVMVLNKNGEPEIRELKYISAQMKQSVLEKMYRCINSLSTKKKNNQDIGILHYIKEYKSIELPQYGKTYKILGKNKIKIQNISGNIIVNGLDQFIDIPNIEIANAHLLNKPNGYYIAITTYQYSENLPEKEYIGEEIGIDMGIKDNIILSNGEKYKVFIDENERLKQLDSKLSQQHKGSNNQQKTKLLIRREYQKMINKRNDIANKLVAHIKSYKNIYMQDENLTGWQSGYFGKQVNNSILGRVKSKLIEDKQSHVLDRYVPTTKYCPICGNIKEDITLDDRIYHCNMCGYEADRDIHSANNMIIMYKNNFTK